VVKAACGACHVFLIGFGLRSSPKHPELNFSIASAVQL
jgi:hypothetical protein